MFTSPNIKRISSIAAAAIAALSLSAAAGAGTASAITKACTNPVLCKAPLEAIVNSELYGGDGYWFGANDLSEHLGAKTFSILTGGHEQAGGTITTSSSGATKLLFTRGLREKIQEIVHVAPGTLAVTEYIHSTVPAAGTVITVGAHYSGICEGEGWHATISPSYSQAEASDIALVQKEADPDACLK